METGQSLRATLPYPSLQPERFHSWRARNGRTKRHAKDNVCWFLRLNPVIQSERIRRIIRTGAERGNTPGGPKNETDFCLLGQMLSTDYNMDL